MRVWRVEKSLVGAHFEHVCYHNLNKLNNNWLMFGVQFEFV